MIHSPKRILNQSGLKQIRRNISRHISRNSYTVVAMNFPLFIYLFPHLLRTPFLAILHLFIIILFATTYRLVNQSYKLVILSYYHPNIGKITVYSFYKGKKKPIDIYISIGFCFLLCSFLYSVGVTPNVSLNKWLKDDKELYPIISEICKVVNFVVRNNRFA